MIGKLLLSVLLVLATFAQAQGAVIGKEVSYRAGDVDLKGYIAFDDAIAGKRPGVIVVHEWWGLNDYARRRADMLAKEGYVALAVDMYGKGQTADHPDEAGKFAALVSKNLPLERQRFLAGLEVLKAEPHTDATRLAAIGYCFGGGVVLQMARDGVDLKGVVSFHGELGTQNLAKPGAIKARILVFQGGDDKFIPMKIRQAFIKEMTEAGADFTFHSFPGALHSFTNPDADELGKKFNLPLAYQEKADLESWGEMLDFFNHIFGR